MADLLMTADAVAVQAKGRGSVLAKRQRHLMIAGRLVDYCCAS
jgi:hypothetical protein